MNIDLYQFQIEFNRDGENGDHFLSEVQNGFVLATSFEEAREKIDKIYVNGYRMAVHLHLYGDDVILV